MRFGKVIGVKQRSDRVDVLILDEEDGYAEAIISLCNNNKSRSIRPRDMVWASDEREFAHWSSNSLGVNDIQVPLHKTRWDGTFVCGCRPTDVPTEKGQS